ncbi:MAG: AEC family transporter, partial [Alphaproteobacteria bacterium]
MLVGFEIVEVVGALVAPDLGGVGPVLRDDRIGHVRPFRLSSPTQLATTNAARPVAVPTGARVLTVVDLILPIFAVIALGWGATFTAVFDAASARALSGFVFFFAIPLMLFERV